MTSVGNSGTTVVIATGAMTADRNRQKKKYTASDKKADIAIGVAAVAAVIALSK